nr:glycoside hydrolase/phage tail family protein [Hyphomicrobiales bacterium]
IALCEGEVTRLGRIWADGDEITLTDYTFRFYRGTQTQTPDSLIEAKVGAGHAPAYRGIAYIVFERLPLENFGNRIPQLNFEVFRAVDAFESQVRGVTIIPAAGEFAYHPEEVRVNVGAGTTYSENRHTTLAQSDFSASVDQLEDIFPNCRAISVFSAWFGDDLRCAHCQIKPRVDNREKGEGTTPVSWDVAGLNRATAEAVSVHDGRPAYGGTPSDNSMIAAIEDLSARGLDVLFTPFLLMDTPEGNGLEDPYTGVADQPTHPWRGRVTCNPAPGVYGSPDKTVAARTQIDAFFGSVSASDFSFSSGTLSYNGPAEWSYSRFILHNAAVCKAAGGVAAFVIGSEMRGLTWVRDSPDTYPFVSKLISLAAEVRALLPDAQITYAADWSEYFGHQPADGSGDIYFHLDPLWADGNIDAVAIDAYWPLSDWRDGNDHLDYLAGTRFAHDLSYLKNNIEGGEGYDFYYASNADRDAQARTPITDGSGKPWMFRYKDIKSWWGNQHFNRPGGAEIATPTAWTPESKPIWFTELGCPAIDKGSNQPNVFFDPKSSESHAPYYSRGSRDDLIQRRYLRAFLEYYDPNARDFAETNNPASTAYAGRMVELSRIMLYTWDARPYPAFPALKSIWSDGENWPLGHWLTGRVSDAPLPELIDRLLTDHDFTGYEATQLSGTMAGYVIDRTLSARDAIQPLETAFFFDSYESEGMLRFAHRGYGGSLVNLSPDDLVETNPDQPRYEFRRTQESDLPSHARITYIDGDREYVQGSAEGQRIPTGGGRVSNAHLPIVTRYGSARAIAETMLHESWASREAAQFALPPSRLSLDASDLVTLRLGRRDAPLRLTQLATGQQIKVQATSIEPQLYDNYTSPQRETVTGSPTIYGAQLGVFLDLPLITGNEIPHAGCVAAFGNPWPGGVAFYRSPASTGFSLKAQAVKRATLGVTLSDFHSGPTSRWDNGNRLRIKLSMGELASAEPVIVLGGANYCALQNADGEWEVLQFLNAGLIGAATYELSGLLRGQSGTEAAMRDPVAAGARFVLLDSAITQADMRQDEIGLAFNWKYGPQLYDIGDSSFQTVTHAFNGVGFRPLSPVHIRGVQIAEGLQISWTRRTRIGGDSWEQSDIALAEASEAYDVDILDGENVVRTLTRNTPSAIYTTSQQIADFGQPRSEYSVRVRQLSVTYGRGQAREAIIP